MAFKNEMSNKKNLFSRSSLSRISLLFPNNLIQIVIIYPFWNGKEGINEKYFHRFLFLHCHYILMTHKVYSICIFSYKLICNMAYCTKNPIFSTISFKISEISHFFFYRNNFCRPVCAPPQCLRPSPLPPLK